MSIKYNTDAAEIWLKDKKTPRWREEAAQAEWGLVVAEACRLIVKSYPAYTARFAPGCSYQGAGCSYGVRADALLSDKRPLVFVGTPTGLNIYIPSHVKNNATPTTYLGEAEPVGTVSGSYNVDTKRIEGDGDVVLAVVQVIASYFN